MASEPYVEIFIDTLSFLSLEDASSNLHVELVQRDEGTAPDAEALESAMRATVKRYWKNGVTLDLDSCRLKVNAYVPQTKAGAADPMVKFKDDVAGLQDCKVVSVSGRGDLVRARDERLATSVDDKECRFILVASMTTPGLLFLKTNHPKETIRYLPGYVPLNASNQRVDTTIISAPNKACFNELKAHVDDRNGGQRCCNNFHLGSHGCDDAECPFDHSDISENMMSVLRFICQIKPCLDGAACRRIHCYFGHACRFGHACHRDDCGGKHPVCKFRDGEHGVDQTIHHWEMGRLHYDICV